MGPWNPHQKHCCHYCWPVFPLSLTARLPLTAGLSLAPRLTLVAFLTLAALLRGFLKRVAIVLVIFLCIILILRVSVSPLSLPLLSFSILFFAGYYRNHLRHLPRHLMETMTLTMSPILPLLSFAIPCCTGYYRHHVRHLPRHHESSSASCSNSPLASFSVVVHHHPPH